MSDYYSPIRKRSSVWEWIFPIISACAAVAILIATQFATLLGFQVLNIDYSKYEGTCSLIYSVIAICLLLLYSYISRLFYSDLKSGLLIRKPRFIELISTIVIALGLLGFVTIYMMVVNLVAEAGGEASAVASDLEKYESTVDRYSEVAVEVVPFFDKFLNYLAVSIFIPIAEELVFRGIILGQFMKKYNALVSILISATIFGVLHGISIHIGYALVSGIIIGSVYYFTSSIFMSTLVHMIFNFFGGTLSLILTDGWFNMPVETSNAILIRVSTINIMCLTPATLFFILLWVRKNKENKLAREAQEELLNTVNEAE